MKFTLQKAYALYSTICLFVMPLVFFPFLHHSFTQGKQLFFKTAFLIFIFSATLLIFWSIQKLTIRACWNSRLTHLLAALGGVFIIATLTSPTPLPAFYGTYTRGMGLLMMLFVGGWFVLASLLARKKDIRNGLSAAWFAGIFVALYALAQKFGYDPFFSRFKTNIFVERSFSFMGNPSFLGQYMVVAIIIGCWLFFESSKKISRILYGLGTGILFAGLYASETRSAFLALGIAVIFFSIKELFTQKRILFQKKNTPILALVVIVFLMLGIVASRSGLLDGDRFSFSEKAFRSLSSRFELWKGTTELIRQRPFGHGLDTFYIYAPEKASKSFFTREEDINTSADRVHNGFLEVSFSGGVVAGALYLGLFVYLLMLFWLTQKPAVTFLSLALIANIIQNQFGFPDIALFTFVAFVAAGLVVFESRKTRTYLIKMRRLQSALLICITAVFCGVLFFHSVVRPLFSHVNYTLYKEFSPRSYRDAIESLKTAAHFTPYYSELWYELMIVDKSSMKTALEFVEKIEGSSSGNLLAWKGNYFATSNPQMAYSFYEAALQKNPQHPNWLRAYADALYVNKEYDRALAVYERYLRAIPDYWRFRDRIDTLSPEEKRQYEVFQKHVPYFAQLLGKIEQLRKKVREQASQPAGP